MSPNWKTSRHVNELVLAAARRRPCIAGGIPCGRADAAHVLSRGHGGGDYDWNVVPLCRKHHTEQHQIGWVAFAGLYMGVALELVHLGWTVENGRFVRPSSSP